MEVKALCAISAEAFSVERINLFTALWNSLRKQDHTMYTDSIQIVSFLFMSALIRYTENIISKK